MSSIQPKAIPLIYSNSHRLSDDHNSLIRVSRGEGDKWLVNPKAIQIINGIGREKISVVSINGVLREGKSYIASWLLGSSNAFSIGSTTNPETYGIWISTEIRTYNGCKLILLDCEGVGATGSTKHSDDSLFTLSCLLSSTFIYNSKGVATDTDLDKLHFVGKMSERIYLKKVEVEESTQIVRYMPHFVWLFRDFHLDPVAEGKASSILDYVLKEVLKKNREEGRKAARDRNLISFFILNWFRSVYADALPIPHVDKNIINNMGEVLDSQLSPEFVQKRNEFIRTMLERVDAKIGYNNQPVNGPLLATMIDKYVEVVNDPTQIPSIQSVWDSAIEIRKTESLASAQSYYQSTLKSLVNGRMPMEYNELLDIHDRVMKDSIIKLTDSLSGLVVGKEFEGLVDIFTKSVAEYNSSKDSKQVVGGYLFDLVVENNRQSKHQCQRVLEPLARDFESNYLKSTPPKKFAAVLKQLDVVKHQFFSQARGPAKNEVFGIFNDMVKSQEEAFKKMHDYDEALLVAKVEQERADQAIRLKDQQLQESRKLAEAQKRDHEVAMASIKHNHDIVLQNLQTQFDKQAKECNDRIEALKIANREENAQMQETHRNQIAALQTNLQQLNQQLAEAKNNNNNGLFGFLEMVVEGITVAAVLL